VANRARQIRKAKHLGLTLQSYRQYAAGAVPLALAERSPRGIRQAAQQQVNAAYNPALKALNVQEARVKALQEKRDADNQQFASWVSTQSDKLRADAIAQSSALRDNLARGQQEFAQHLQDARDTGAANLQRQGVTSTPGGANEAQIAGNAAADQAGVQSQVNTAQAKIGAGMDLTNATLANNAAVVAAGRSKDYAASLDDLMHVADARQKTLLQKGSDTARAIQALLGQEVTKAQAIIAAQQFTTKLTQDTKKSKRTSTTTRRGQDITSADKAKDRAAKGKDVNKYGYTADQWKGFKASHRQRIIKEFDKSGGSTGPSSAASQKATAKAQHQVDTATRYATGEATLPALKDGTAVPPPPKAKSGHVKPLLDWFAKYTTFDPTVAQVAVFKQVYPKAKFNHKTAPHTFKQWQTYIKNLTGSR
jgi:hypothetical protein